jgi:hypothetical protein
MLAASKKAGDLAWVEAGEDYRLQGSQAGDADWTLKITVLNQ